MPQQGCYIPSQQYYATILDLRLIKFYFYAHIVHCVFNQICVTDFTELLPGILAPYLAVSFGNRRLWSSGLLGSPNSTASS